MYVGSEERWRWVRAASYLILVSACVSKRMGHLHVLYESRLDGLYGPKRVVANNMVALWKGTLQPWFSKLTAGYLLSQQATNTPVADPLEMFAGVCVLIKCETRGHELGRGADRAFALRRWELLLGRRLFFYGFFRWCLGLSHSAGLDAPSRLWSLHLGRYGRVRRCCYSGRRGTIVIRCDESTA
jgi:hypothetical protein